MHPSTDDHFQKKEQNGPQKFRDTVFTCCFENTVQETRHVSKWNETVVTLPWVNEDQGYNKNPYKLLKKANFSVKTSS